jgi:hypothetical protein
MNNRVKEWIKRYLPAEILSVIATLAGAALAYRLTGNRVTTALAATWAGNIFYFGTILISDIVATQRHLATLQKTYTWKTLLKNIRALFVEFGIAEVLDTFIIRPALMYYLPLAFGHLNAGIIVAKFAADITFYVPAILAYEWSKKKWRKFH